MTERFPITPDSKVAALLESYPELEDVLIAMAPPFKKLKNPVLRRSVAKVASLRQAALVGGIGIEQMVNQLRAKVGQAPVAIGSDEHDEHSYYTDQPAWYQKDHVVTSIKASEVDLNVMPLNPLMHSARRLGEGEIIELITTFLPVPGIDVMRKKGFLTWSTKQGDVTKTYFSKPKID
jgi:hypothetical protein